MSNVSKSSELNLLACRQVWESSTPDSLGQRCIDAARIAHPESLSMDTSLAHWTSTKILCTVDEEG